MSAHPAIDEVVRQHVFIQQWLSGTDRSGFATFESSLADDFEIVTPGGDVVAKPPLVDGFRDAFGTAPGLQIDVREALLVAATDALAVVRYEEWQSHCDEPNQRVSTATFRSHGSAPLGWAWVALQETWLAD